MFLVTGSLDNLEGLEWMSPVRSPDIDVDYCSLWHFCSGEYRFYCLGQDGINLWSVACETYPRPPYSYVDFIWLELNHQKLEVSD